MVDPLHTDAAVTTNPLNANSITNDQSLKELLQSTSELDPSVLESLLQQAEPEMLAILHSLTNDTVFNLCEKSLLLRYQSNPQYQAGFEVLYNEALKRHNAQLLGLPVVNQRDYAIMLVDYDRTLSRTLKPLSPEMADHICFFLERGIKIVLASTQPLQGNGLVDIGLASLQAHIASTGRDSAILQNLLLLPTEGVAAFRPDATGVIDPENPLYNIGFTEQSFTKFESIVTGIVQDTAKKIIPRGGYISIHFNSLADMHSTKAELAKALENFEHQISFRQAPKPDPSKIVLHARLAIASKTLSRDFVVSQLAKQLEDKIGRPLKRSEILVAGDKMGTSAGKNDDTAMFVFGTSNIALGIEACPGADKTYLGQEDQGTLALFSDLRKRILELESYAERDWEEVTKDLDQLGWMDVYTLREAVNSACAKLTDKLDSFRENLERYCSERLTNARSELEVISGIKVTPESSKDFFEQASYFHQGWNTEFTLAELYSLLKYGDHEAIEYFTDSLAAAIQQSYADDIKSNPSKWAIAVPAGHLDDPGGAEKASYLFGKRLADKLGVELIPLGLAPVTQQEYYCAMTNPLERFDVAMAQYSPEAHPKENVILADDAVVSGATLWAAARALELGAASKVKVLTAGSIDVDLSDNAVEAVCNDAVLSNATVESEAMLVKKLLTQQEGPITTRTLKRFLELEPKTIEAILESTPVERLNYLKSSFEKSLRIRNTEHYKKGYAVAERFMAAKTL